MGIRRRRDSDREKTHGKRRDLQSEMGLKTEKGLGQRTDSQKTKSYRRRRDSQAEKGLTDRKGTHRLRWDLRQRRDSD